MREFIISINDFSKASKFCELSAISKCINVELKSERYIINAKSLLGIFSLDLSKNVTCMVEGTDKNIKKFENELKKLNILV